MTKSPVKCLVCKLEDVYYKRTCIICDSCMQEESTIRAFVNHRKNFYLYVDTYGGRMAYKSNFNTLGLVRPEAYIMYVSAATGHLLCGMLSLHQPESLDHLNVYRTPKGAFVAGLVRPLDKIQYEEIVCVLCPLENE